MIVKRKNEKNEKRKVKEITMREMDEIVRAVNNPKMFS